MFAGLTARLYEPLVGGLLRGLRSTVIELCPQQGPVLDCCCGPGGLLRRMDGGQGVSLLGLDNDAAMLAEASRHRPCPFLLRGDAAFLPFKTHSLAAACICMALHAMPTTTADSVLQEICRVARVVIVADYCLPERNLYLPSVWLGHTVERLVGGEHYRCYSAFMARGGLEGVLHAARRMPRHRATVLGGAARVVVL